MRRHELDLTSLLAGLVFVAIAATYLLSEANGNGVDATWVLPVALIALGLAGLVGGVGRAVRKPPPDAGAALPLGEIEDPPSDTSAARGV